MNQFDRRALTPSLSEARLARQYDAVRARVRRTGGRVWMPWTVAAVAMAALVAVWVVARRPAASEAWLVDGAVLESGAAGERTHLTLPEGSRVDLAPNTRARLTSARRASIRIDVETGRVEVEATHVEGRTFIVGAGGYEVHVIGTHFVVERAPGSRVTVSVDRGIVQVTNPVGEGRRLTAGEQWSAPDGAPSVAVDSAAASGSQVPSASAAPSAAPAASSSAIVAPTEVSSSPPEETAKGLFDDAQHARADGRPRDAARAFDRLRHAFRHDRRASLAAFELGRLRLDALGDPRGAEDAFRDAMALGSSSPFREDAEARHVESLARMGDTSRCTSARDAYLARWPTGTYRRAVELYCGVR